MRVQTTHRTGRSDRGRVLLLKVSGTTDVGSNKCAQTVKRQTAQQSLLCASGEQATAAVIAFTEGGTRVHAVPFAVIAWGYKCVLRGVGSCRGSKRTSACRVRWR